MKFFDEVLNNLKSVLPVSCPEGMIYDANFALEKVENFLSFSSVVCSKEKELFVILELAPHVDGLSKVSEIISQIWHGIRHLHFSSCESFCHDDGIVFNFLTVPRSESYVVIGKIVVDLSQHNILCDQLGKHSPAITSGSIKEHR